MVVALVAHDTQGAFYCRQVALHGAPVLILGCGNGRIAFQLAARGHEVVAVDPSAVMIRSAEERRARENSEGGRLRLIEADLRSLRLPDRFPLVAAPHNALSLMTTLGDLESMLATVSHHLEKRGVFVFDVSHPAAERQRAGPTAYGPPEQKLSFPPHLEERRRTADRRGQRAIRRMRVRQFGPRELDACLAGAGLTPHERYGRFDEKAYDEDDPVQIVVAQRGPA